ncbi:MAG: acyloxyacyl hydrolase [Bacteroidales bacterium]|nr:acyloxyacyl hydrolase [Bacteroidales bacterium]
MKVHYGAVYPHHKAIHYLLSGNIHGFEISLSTKSSGRHIWEQLYRFPDYGFAYNFTNLSNPKELGYAHGWFGFIEVPFFYKPGNNFMLSYQVDGGFTYITNKFDIENNPLNLAISSAFNVYIGFDVIARFKIASKSELKTAFELTHYSNGKWRSPNLGLNSVCLSAAWLYSFSPSYMPRVAVRNDFEPKRNFYEIVFNGGFKRDDLLNEKLYRVSTVIFDYYHAHSLKYAYGAGFDFMFDESLGPLKQHYEKTGYNYMDNYQTGAHIGFLVRYGKLNVLLNAGCYITANYFKYSRVFGRFGMRYALSKKILLNFSIKSHYAIADYLEWGIGYRFNTSGK